MIKEDGQMVTARQEPRLVLVSVTCQDHGLVLSGPGVAPLLLPSKPPSSNTLHDCRYSAGGPGRGGGPATSPGFLSGCPLHSVLLPSAQEVVRSVKEGLREVESGSG